jgi:DNA-binding NarL/FixJ family response regulator
MTRETVSERDLRTLAGIASADRPEPPARTAGPGRHLQLYLNRGPGADFSERDRAALTLLLPHLQEAYLDAERRRRPVPRLTARHWDLLRLLADTQIARHLGITEGTVRTHLENMYTRLNVSSRAAAVTRAFADGGAAVNPG